MPGPNGGDPRTKRFKTLNEKQKRRGTLRTEAGEWARDALIDEVFPNWRDSFSTLDFSPEPIINACVRHVFHEGTHKSGPIKRPSAEDAPKVIALLVEWGFLAA